MGNRLLKQCTTSTNKTQDYIGIINDGNEPESEYAIQENVKYESPHNVGHILTESNEIKVDESIDRGKKIQNSYFIKQYEIYYTGEWKKGRPHGLGDVVFKNGALFRGTFNAGKASGNDCLFIMEDGSYYRGGLQNNAFNGHGKYVDQNKHSYDGQWKDNCPHGTGRQNFVNGDLYQGPYQYGVKCGLNGIYTWFEHPQYLDYKGAFKNNYMDGQGTLRKQDGTTISGNFREDNVQDARIQNKDIKFAGEIKNNMIQGHGKYTFIQDNKTKIYEGNFENNQPNGQGILKVDNNEVRNGNWFNGQNIRCKGFTEEEITKYLDMVQGQFNRNQYLQDLVQAVNQNIQQFGQYNVQLVNNDNLQQYIGGSNKYGVLNFQEDNLVIIQNQ